LPVGIAVWAYDANGFSAPAQGSQASVVLAATPGKTYTAAWIDASFTQGAAAATEDALELLDGATEIHRHNLAVPGVAGNMATYPSSPIARRGTTGNSMTLKFSGGDAGITQRVTLGAYLR
jgi:hypothetical protein